MKAEIEPLFRPWLSTLKMRSENTARSYETALDRFFAILGDQITPADMSAYLDSLDGLAPGSKAHHISAVRSFLKFCQRQGAVAQSLLDFLVRPRVTVTSFNRYLTVEEAQQLAQTAKVMSPKHHAVILLLLGTGLRVGEAVSVCWRDLFLDPEGRLGLRVVGKGNKERVVRVREDVWQALVALHGSDALNATDTTPLLPSKLGKAFTTRGLHKLMTKVVYEAGLDKPASPHYLRHTHATLAALGGASVFAIKDSLGHSQLETSQRYVHWAKGLSETTVDSLPAF